MSVVTAYITVDDATSLLAGELVSTDERMAAWSEAVSGDQGIYLRRATADINAVRYRGAQKSREQLFAWPRTEMAGENNCDGHFDCQPIDPDPDPASDAPSQDLALIPRDVRIACAIQGAHHAARAVGADATHALEDAARRGVVSQGGGGFSQSVNLDVANDPWARLCIEVQQLLRRYRIVGVMLA